MKYELFIADPSGEAVQLPAVEEGVVWTTHRRGTPGKLTFSVLKDDKLNFQEGAAVRLQVDGTPVFFGFVFTKKRDKRQIISVTAYDQMRYLLNKDTLLYEGKTATELLQMLAGDFGLQTGELADTGYVIPSRVEDNKSLFEMVENALDLTLQNTGEMFILYDDGGKLTLKNLADMQVSGPEGALLLDVQSGEDFDYSSTIDSNTYNKVKLSFENETTGKRDIYIAQHGENINKWGVLQYFDTLEKSENGQAKADALLKLYNAKTRTLRLRSIFGDLRVRAGSLVAVSLPLGDIAVNSFLLVETATHTFKHDTHFMDLTLRGGALDV